MKKTVELASLDVIRHRFENYLKQFSTCYEQLPDQLGPCQSRRPSILLTNFFYQVNWRNDYEEQQYQELKGLMKETLECGEALYAQLPSPTDTLRVKIAKLQHVGDSDKYDVAYHYFSNLLCLSLLSRRADRLIKSLCYYQRIPLTFEAGCKVIDSIVLAPGRSTMVSGMIDASLRDLLNEHPAEKDLLKAFIANWTVNDDFDAQAHPVCFDHVHQLLIMKHRLCHVAQATNKLVGMSENPQGSPIEKELAAWLKAWDAGNAHVVDLKARVFDHLVSLGRIDRVPNVDGLSL